MVKYAVWGAGHRGRILYELLGADRIAALLIQIRQRQEQRISIARLLIMKRTKRNTEGM